MRTPSAKFVYFFVQTNHEVEAKQKEKKTERIKIFDASSLIDLLDPT